MARWTVVAIPRSAALRESAIRADDPQVWRVAVYRWRWVAELVARRRTRNSDRFAGTFDYTVVPGVPTKLRVPNEGKADA